MAPPKSKKSTPRKPARSDSLPQSEGSLPVSKKRKIDWATIDDDQPFQGFELKSIKSKSVQPAKRHKSGEPTDVSNDGYKDAPLDADIVQKNPYPDADLSDTHYLVEPRAEWESTLRYRKFTISEAEFEVGQTIFVNKSEEEHAENDSIQYWVARVLEVRAGDASHVYLRVYWLYRPEDLPGGRQPHHGEAELIVSNDMAIIEALTVSDYANVVRWDEDPDTSDWPLKEQLFWRQTYDLEKPKTQRLSKLRTFCIDDAPCNPDEALVNCPSCQGWLHAHCLEEKAIEEAEERYKTPVKGKGRPTKSKKKNGRKSSSGAPFAAELISEESGQLRLTVTDRRPEENKRQWNVDIRCLLCKELIEKASSESLMKINAKEEPQDSDVLPSPEVKPDDRELLDLTNRPKTDPDITLQSPQVPTPAPEAQPVATAQPRERGRPRKLKSESAPVTLSGTSGAVAKRGRPPKPRPNSMPCEPPTSATASVSTSSIPATQRKRGRPPKAKSSASALSTIPDEPVLPTTNGDIQHNRPQKRKRSSSSPPPNEENINPAEITPPPKPLSQSILQSVHRSVKRLLWSAPDS